MTEREAIKGLQYLISGKSNQYPPDYDTHIQIAIHSLEEVQQHRALGTVEELREAMEKQKAKKPHKYVAFDGIGRNGCANCFEKHGDNEILYAGQKYCSVCGQAIDWSESQEDTNG